MANLIYRFKKIIDAFNRLIFGYDVFISYSRKDSLDYAYALATRLMEEDCECYIDQLASTGPGAEISDHIKNAIRKSKGFILIGSAGAQESHEGSAIIQELDIHLAQSGNKFLVPININQALDTDNVKHHRPNATVIEHRIFGLTPIPETPSNFESKKPGDEVVERVLSALNFTRKAIRLRNIAIGIFVAALVLGGFTFMEVLAVKETKVELGEAIKSTKYILAKDTILKEQLVSDSVRIDSARSQLGLVKDSVTEQRALVMAEEINAEVIANRISAPDDVQLRALLSIKAYEKFPNPVSIQNLAYELNSAFHYLVKLKAGNYKHLCVSANGKFVAGWSDKGSMCGLFKLNKNGLTLVHQQYVPTIKSGSAFQCMAVDNRGTCIALNFSTSNLCYMAFINTRRDWIFDTISPHLNDDNPKDHQYQTQYNGLFYFESLQFTSNGKYLAGSPTMSIVAGGDPKPCYFFQVDSGFKAIQIPMPRKNARFLDISISDSCNKAAVLYSLDYVGADNEIYIYSLPALKKYSTVEASYNTMGLRFTPNGSRLVVHSDEKYQFIKDIRPGARKPLYNNCDKYEVPFSRQQILFLDTNDNMIVIGNKYNAGGRRSTATVISAGVGIRDVGDVIFNYGPRNEGDIESLAVDSDYNVITADAGGTITIWQTSEKLNVPKIGSPAKTFLAETTDKLYFSGKDTDLKLVLNKVSDWKTGHPVITKLARNDLEGQQFCVSRKGDLYASVVLDNAVGSNAKSERHIHVKSAISNQLLYNLRYPYYNNISEYAQIEIAIDPQQKFLVAADNNPTVSIWKLDSKKSDLHPVTVKLPQGWVSDMSVCFSNNGEVLVAAFGDTIYLFRDWKNENLKNFTTLVVSGKAHVKQVITNQNDSLLAAVLSQGIIRIWSNWLQHPLASDIMTDNKDGPLSNYEDGAGIDFHPTKDIITFLDYNFLQVRDLTQSEPWIKIPIMKKGMYWPKFSKDGRYVITARGFFYSYYLWRPEDIIEEAKKHFIYRDLTEQEKERYLPGYKK